MRYKKRRESKNKKYTCVSEQTDVKRVVKESHVFFCWLPKSHMRKSLGRLKSIRVLGAAEERDACPECAR